MKMHDPRIRRRVVLVAIVCGVALTQSFDMVRWRTRLIALKAAGQIPDLSWEEIFRFMPPGSGVYLRPVVDSRNPYTTLLNERTSPDEVRAGREWFGKECAQCHGPDARGGTGPDLTRGHFLHGSSDWALFRAISRGIPGTAMEKRDLAPTAVWQLVAFVKHAAEIRGSDQLNPAGDGTRTASISPVTFERLAAASRESSDWLTYSGAYDGQRYSHLAQIRRENVAQLGVKWLFQLPTDVALVENSPLVADNIMFVSLPPGDVWAIDARTGEVLWRHVGLPAPADLKISVNPVNRGLAILGTTLFVARIDAQLVALDVATGKQLWTTRVADYREGYTMTGAPLALKDVIVVGVGGGEQGIRGFLDGYAPADGRRVWRFNTVPGPGEPGHDTWGGRSWERGGAPTWLTGSYDPELDLLYWGVGNPGPTYQGDVRPGDNLYSNSIIALEGRSGRLRWHFQFTPHDEHDWDAVQIPVLVDRSFEGQPRKLMYWANRNGFYYVLDRVTGRFLHGRPYVKQTWAQGLDNQGRPIDLPSARPTREGVLVFPSMLGATSWWSPSYDPASNAFFVAAKEGASVFTKSMNLLGHDGPYTASSVRPGPGRAQSSIRALDGSTGEQRWLHPIADNQPLGGLAATAGGLVFASDGAAFLALDSRNGDELWRLNLGDTIYAAPVTYLAEGRQQVTIAAGRIIVTLCLGGK
jgi:alcohol dehydrogenase (cytochrome c)